MHAIYTFDTEVIASHLHAFLRVLSLAMCIFSIIMPHMEEA